VEVVDQDQETTDHYSDSDSDSGSRSDSSVQGRRLKDEQLRVFGNSYQTVIVILQDLVSYFCMYVFMYICMNVCMCMYVCMNTSMHTYEMNE
jgi:hypothetical protein